MAMIITCDICNKEIKPIDRNGGETNSVQLNDYQGSDLSLPYVCQHCFNSIKNTITLLRSSTIEQDENLRQSVYNVYIVRCSPIEAIKFLREKTGLGLKESKDMVEGWRAKYSWPRDRR